MIRRDIVLAPEARGDLIALYDWSAGEASPDIALDYIERIEKFIAGFDVVSEHGARRDDIRQGLRIVGFERRLTIDFSVEETGVTIQRLLYGGRDWEGKVSN